MASENFEIDLEEWGGAHRFRSYEQLQRWVSDEQERWNWLQSAEYRDVADLRNAVTQQFNWLVSSIENNRQQGHPLEANGDPLNRVFRNAVPKTLHSEGIYGHRVLDIYQSHGAIPAAWAYGFATQRLGLSHPSNPEELSGLLMMSSPSTISPNGTAARLATERRNLRERADRLIERIEEAERQRKIEWRDARRFSRRVTKTWAKRRFENWREQFDRAIEEGARIQGEYAERAINTQAEFDSTKAAYEEAMRLQAPVQYWKDKSAQHKTAEDEARGRVVLFFPLVAFVLLLAFGLSAWFLLERTTKESPTALFLIVSGGLATFAGIAFWAGRLLTRLYLSEHHLRNDAEERAVMTTTYLALTKDKAAEETDRQIILAALFRNTPDGIVKDDSPMDLSIPMLLAKIGGPKS